MTRWVYDGSVTAAAPFAQVFEFQGGEGEAEGGGGGGGSLLSRRRRVAAVIGALHLFPGFAAMTGLPNFVNPESD